MPGHASFICRNATWPNSLSSWETKYWLLVGTGLLGLHWHWAVVSGSCKAWNQTCFPIFPPQSLPISLRPLKSFIQRQTHFFCTRKIPTCPFPIITYFLEKSDWPLAQKWNNAEVHSSIATERQSVHIILWKMTRLHLIQWTAATQPQTICRKWVSLTLQKNTHQNKTYVPKWLRKAAMYSLLLWYPWITYCTLKKKENKSRAIKRFKNQKPSLSYISC